jgi:hypothetical protein
LGGVRGKKGAAFGFALERKKQGGGEEEYTYCECAGKEKLLRERRGAVEMYVCDLS